MTKKKRSSGILWAFALIGLIIGIILFFKIYNMTEQLENQKQTLAGINTEIQRAEDETEAIKNEIRYRETDDYIEDQARESLGLRYPDEIIIVPDRKQE